MDFENFDEFLREANTKPDYTTNAGSYYKDLARKQKLIELLSQRIWEYDKTLAKSLQEIHDTLTYYITEWDKRIENFDNSVMILLRQWIDDGTFALIINEEIFNGKLDTSVYEQNKENTDDRIEKLHHLFVSVERVTMNYDGSLAELNNDGLADTTRNYVILDENDTVNYGYVVYHDTSNWVKGWVYNSLVVGENTITPEHTTFLRDFTAYDSAVDITPMTLSTRGDFYDPANGLFSNTENTQNFKNTGKLMINEKSIVRIHGVSSIVFYDVNDNRAGSSEHGSDEALSNIMEITPPENVSYMIANIPKPYWWDSDDPDYPNLTAKIELIPIKQKSSVMRITDDNLEKTPDTSYVPENISHRFTFSEDGYVINPLTGVTNVQAGRRHSSKEILPHVQYATFGVASIIFHDKDDNFIPESLNFSSDVEQSTWQFWTLPKNAVYVSFNLFTYYYNRFEIVQMQSSELKRTLKNTLLESIVEKEKRFLNTTLLHLGDSIVGNYSYPSDVPSYISNVLGAKVVNGGFGGTRASRHPNDSFNAFSFYELAKSIVSGDFSKQVAASQVTGIGMPPYFRDKVTTIANVNYSTLNMIILSFGTNDWNGVVEIDNPTDPLDTNTYLGAIRYGIKIIQEKYPHIKFVISTPMYRFKEDNSEDSDTWLAGTKTLTDFVDSLYNIEDTMHVPVIDCYYTLGINKHNKLHYFHKDDGTHPIWRGRKLLGEKIAEGILNTNNTRSGIKNVITLFEKQQVLLTDLSKKITEIESDVNEKANKKQGEWITPTLLNNTAAISGNAPQYYKDEFNIVRLRGKVSQGTLGVILFTLPVGYRPSTDLKIIVSADNGIGVLRIGPSGAVYLASGKGTTEISFDGISFKSE